MFERWYYARDGKTHGPMTIAEAVRRAAAGELRANDRLWPADFDPQMAFPASSTIDFQGLGRTAAVAPPPPPAPMPAPRAPAAGVPDWLSDVAEVEKKAPAGPRAPAPAPAPSAPAAAALPDWLSDVEVTDRFIVRGPPPSLRKTAPAPPPPAPPPRAPAARVPTVPPPAPARPVVPAPPPSVSPPAARVVPLPAPPIPMAIPVAPPAPPIPMAIPVAPVPVLPTAAPVVPPSPPASAPPAPPATPGPEETGFDADTGQVLDAEKYRRWQKLQKEVKTAAAEAVGETIYEVFLRANRALQDWLDQETNRPLLAQGLPAIRADAGVQALIASFGNWGQDFTNKLWQRLEFLVTNRVDFYASRA